MKRLFAFIILFCSTALLLSGKAAFAQSGSSGSFTISPASTILTKDNTQQFSVSLATGGHPILGADTIINFPKDKVDVIGVTSGDFFGTNNFNSAIDTANGRIELHGFFFTSDPKSGTGTFATFQLRAKVGSETGSLTFTCGSGSPTSKMPDENGVNILSCSSLNQSNFSFTGDTTPTISPTTQPTTTVAPTITIAPSPTPTTTPQPTATQAPQPPGNVDPSCNGLSLTPSVGNKPLEVTLYCAGEDKDGDITAAEFLFGDGQVSLVAKNAGSSGMISTTHSYISAGSFAVSCRLRDNHQRFSSIPDACKRTLKVIAPTTVTLARGPTAVKVVQAAAPQTPQLVALQPFVAYDTTPMPTPSEPVIIDDSELVTKKSEGFPRTLIGFGIVLGSLALGGWLILKSRKHDLLPPPPPQPPTV